MEQYGLIRELQALATANDWKFILGTDEYANIEADFHCEVGQLVLWVQMTPNPVRNDGNRISEINYTGAIALLGKFDSDNINRAQLDETWKQKYDRRLEDIQKLFSDKMKAFACSNQLQIESDTYEYVINIFDTNLDGVEGTFTINQDRFSEQETDYNLEIVAEEGGSVLPYEGIQSFIKYSQVALAAFAADTYVFDKWELLVNGATSDKTTPSFIVDMVNNIKATAKFISSLFVIQDVFGTAPIDQQFIDQSTGGNDVTYKNVQVGNFDGVLGGLKIINVTLLTDNLYINTTIKAFSLKNPTFISTARTTNNSYQLIHNSNGTIAFGLWTTSGSTFPASINSYPINKKINIIINHNKTTGVGTLFINNIDDVVYETVNFNLAGDYLLSPTIYISLFNALDSSRSFHGLIYNFEYNKFNLSMQSGDDDIEVDYSGNGYDAEFIGGIIADFRGTYEDGIDSVLINNGHSRFQQIADDTKFIYAPYTDLGVPSKNSIVGYESPVEIIKNVISDNKILYDGVQVAGIETDATFAEIHDLEDSGTIDITKTLVEPLIVSNLKIKA